MIEFKVGTARAERNLKRQFDRARKVFADLTPEMDKVGAWLVQDARRRLADRGSKYPTGRLAKSLTAKAYKRAVTISSVLPYARIQQEGGTVKSKRPGGYLAIPLMARERRNKAWPRHWKSTLVPIKSGGKLFLLSTKFNELVYRLVQQVTIPGRPYLVKSAELVRFMRETIADRLRKVTPK